MCAGYFAWVSCLLEQGVALQAVPLCSLQPLLVRHLRPVLHLQEGAIQLQAHHYSLFIIYYYSTICYFHPYFFLLTLTLTSLEVLRCHTTACAALVCELGQCPCNHASKSSKRRSAMMGMRGCAHLIDCLKVHKVQVVLQLCVWRHVGKGEAACVAHGDLVSMSDS